MSAEDGVAAMRARRERNRRGPIPARHPDTKASPQSGEDAGQQPQPISVSAGGNTSGKDSASDSENASVLDVGLAVGAESTRASSAVPAGLLNGGSPVADEQVRRPATAAPSAQPTVVGDRAESREQAPVSAPSPRRPPRRVGRPRGPERIPLSVRILAELDARLTEEVERQELSPQFIVDQALAEYFARLDRTRLREDGGKAGVSASGNDGGKAGGSGR